MKCGRKESKCVPLFGSGFCRDAVFALTTAYNYGALKCACDSRGSIHFDCEQFGGQCPCRENIIGRQCSKCASGYYDFPNCKPCKCAPTATCDESDGRPSTKMAAFRREI